MSDGDDLSEEEKREIARAEGTDLPISRRPARSAFANPDPSDAGPAGPPKTRAQEVNSEFATKAANTLRSLRWSEEPLLLTAVKTATWGAIFLAVLFEVYIHSPFFTPPGSV